MTALELLLHQTKDAYNWIHKLVDVIPEEKWGITPEGVESNITWQVGHLTLSIYYHSILVIRGHQVEITEAVPLRIYADNYSVNSSPKDSKAILKMAEMMEHLRIIEKKSLEVIGGLSMSDLQEELVPGRVKHPVAKNKLEAIDWNIKHTMWHCGQIATIKRLLDDPYLFELKKVDEGS